MIKERASRLKMLVVLDDVDEKFKFEDIYGSSQGFHSGSRFIITSRNRNVLSTLIENQSKLHEVGSLSPSHSLELFCKHAFRNNSLPPGYKSLADDIVKTTGGLPLTLKVIGSLLFRQDAEFWNDKLEQLHESLRLDDVLDRQKISYDALEYEAQQIFLDIACFFIGTNKEMPSYMWSDCKYHPTSNINILIQRSMIKIGDKDKFQMHDQLRDMGREIVRREDIEHPWMRSRIWSANEGIELLLNKKGSSRVKAICVASSSNVEYELKSEYFANLFELRYFHAKSTGMLTGDFNDLLPNLRWLQLERYNFDGEDGPPLTNFIMKKLVVFVLEVCYITDDWGGWKHMKMAERLKVVRLYYCRGFEKLPYFPRSIEVLSMIRMKDNDIQEVGIGNLKKLKKLGLAGSPLPRDLLLPASITSLRIKKCQSMDGEGGGGGYLDGLQGMTSLQNLLIQQVNGLTRIKGLTNLLCSSTCKLQTLCIIACDDLTELLPSEVQVLKTTPTTLETLIIFFCPELEIGPIIRCLSKFPMLNRLMLGHVKISNEEDLEGLGTLEELVYLKLWLSSSLERLPSLSRLQKLRKLQVLAPGLHKIEGLGELKCLQSLKLRQCASLERLWPDENQQQLVIGDKLLLLDIRNCNSLSADHLSALKNTLPPAVNILWPDEPYTDSDEARTENEDDESVSDDGSEDINY